VHSRLVRSDDDVDAGPRERLLLVPWPPAQIPANAPIEIDERGKIRGGFVPLEREVSLAPAWVENSTAAAHRLPVAFLQYLERAIGPPWAMTKTYEGSCHCGAVRYEVTMPPPSKAFACNCSICSRAGWLLAFTPATTFRLLTGESELSDYRFGKKHVHHLFCRTCGVRSFSRGAGKDGKEMISVNLRCLAGLDAGSLPIESFDGASL
jgi:hypothetical protein